MAQKLNDLEIQKRQVLKQIMENPLFREAIDDVRTTYGREVLRANDPAQRDRLVSEANVLTRVENQLDSYINDLLFLEQKKKEEAA